MCYSPSPPMTGMLVFSDRDTTVASWVGNRTSMSRKPLWGATTSTGASFRSALRPLTFTHRKPREKKTARLRNQTIGWRSQRRQPVTGRERSSSDRPASRNRAIGHTMRKNRAARVIRKGKRMLPRMMPWGLKRKKSHHHLILQVWTCTIIKIITFICCIHILWLPITFSIKESANYFLD